MAREVRLEKVFVGEKSGEILGCSRSDIGKRDCECEDVRTTICGLELLLKQIRSTEIIQIEEPDSLIDL